MNIDLASGRRIRLVRLVQRETYGGLLCGSPSPVSNDEKLADLRSEARSWAAGSREPVLIEPARKQTDRGEWMPRVCCMARFESDALARPDSEPYSSLTIAWLQDEFAMPVDGKVLDEIRKLDWESFAEDWCW